jgi:ArsR family transcriptional regulator, arsenate/arsenite/antimonite-responsive transcriptional repressor
METLIKTVKALADINRLKIFKLLQKRSLCVCEINALVPLAQPTISAHLRILVNANLIKAEKQGLWVIYHKSTDQLPVKLSKVSQSMLDYLETTKAMSDLLKKQKNLQLRGKKQKSKCC